MKLGCPVCKSKFSVAEMMHEKAMEEMIDLAAKFGKNWGLVFEYTECFRQDTWGSVREHKRLRLLKKKVRRRSRKLPRDPRKVREPKPVTRASRPGAVCQTYITRPNH